MSNSAILQGSFEIHTSFRQECMQECRRWLLLGLTFTTSTPEDSVPDHRHYMHVVGGEVLWRCMSQKPECSIRVLQPAATWRAAVCAV